MKRRTSIFLLALLAVGASAFPAEARQSRKKAIWGPIQRNGVSQFPIYHDLGVGIYQAFLRWNEVAATRPANPGDPADPAYRWPGGYDFAVQEARRYGIRISLVIIGTPTWANGGRESNWAPRDPADFATFAAAAARRYPSVGLWQIWGEPTRRNIFEPLVKAPAGLTLTNLQRTGPRRYAQLLDAAYGALKAVRASNLVIGGSSWTAGDIFPFQWVRYLRLPDGRPPRMDLYAHNPFGARPPDTRLGPSPQYGADFADLGRLANWIDRWLGRRGGRRTGPRLKLFLSEYTIPTRRDRRFNFWTNRTIQALWLRQALGITRGWYRIYTFGWADFRDEPRLGIYGGLLDSRGRKKPAYTQFKIG